MQKIFLFVFVFIAGVALGGAVRYDQVQAKLGSVEITNQTIPTNQAPLGAAGGGSCG